ncbi:hypothetical protein CAEBREN_14218 [Caenorhabditis brenneri]|uniref:Uncharacterized protein n=1 Tax=Caenorhabditis brenneri TaxID=135651 RepID=G0NKC4_CAEBE|nr:hypothetical protein CAEBREN_14218 [Caenorhabditis brenneri]
MNHSIYPANATTTCIVDRKRRKIRILKRTRQREYFDDTTDSIPESMDQGHVIRRVDSDVNDTVDEESKHNRLLREVFEEPMLRGELSGSSRRALFPQEENDDEPETQTLDEEEPTTSEAYELDGPLTTLPEPNQQTEQIVANLEDGAPLPPDQEARFLLLLQDPKTPPNLLPVLNGVMKIHNDFVVFLF